MKLNRTTTNKEIIMSLSHHLFSQFGKSNNIKKLYKLTEAICTDKVQYLSKADFKGARWGRTKEVFTLYDGSKLAFFFEKSIPCRVEDYGAPYKV